jgi:hypothetical protein
MSECESFASLDVIYVNHYAVCIRLKYQYEPRLQRAKFM